MLSAPWRQDFQALLLASCLLASPLPLLAQVAPSSASGRAAEGAPQIGKADLDQARRLLAEARNQLEPRHWALLDGKLADAERAWDRFARLARDSGRTAEVARGTEGLVQAGRVREGEGVRALPRVGPLLALLVLLWPARTAGPEYDELPPWLAAQQELEAKLRDLSEASEQVRAEIEAARKRPRKDSPAQGATPLVDELCQPRGSRGVGNQRSPYKCYYDCGSKRVCVQMPPGARCPEGPGGALSPVSFETLKVLPSCE